jgi:hypothetical protein
MSNIKHHRQPGSDSAPQGQVSYWRRAHHDWRFWVGLILMLGAMAIYVLSDNLAFLPHD